MPHKVEVVDITPRFLDFYERATRDALEPDARFALWEETYGFAGVPPTPTGRQKARQLLDEAWDKYPNAMAEIRAGASGLTPDPIDALRQVATLLECDQTITMQVIAFVGGFEGNPFVFAIDGVTTLALPVEQELEQRIFHLPHEMAHVVHSANAGMPISWERSVARLVLEEGIAQRATEQLVPGRTVEEYTNNTEPGWFERCHSQAVAILTDIRSNLEDATSDAITRYTIAPGPGGLTRTAYYAGWMAVGALTRNGWNLANLSKVPEERIPAIVEEGIELVLAESD